MELARLKVFGWGREGEGMTAEEEAFALGVHRRRFGVSDFASIAVPTLADVRLRAPRIAPPAALAAICSTETYDRAAHAHGKGFTDAVRAMLNDFASAPDAVAYPANEQDIAAVMDWAGSAGAVLIPFGGGSSVVGGVTPPRRRALCDQPRSAPARQSAGDRPHFARGLHPGRRVRPGTGGPLRPHGLTLRHFPQSFEFSTLGGWIATRSGGISRRSTRISTISWKACARSLPSRPRSRPLAADHHDHTPAGHRPAAQVFARALRPSAMVIGLLHRKVATFRRKSLITHSAGWWSPGESIRPAGR